MSSEKDVYGFHARGDNGAGDYPMPSSMARKAAWVRLRAPSFDRRLLR